MASLAALRRSASVDARQPFVVGLIVSTGLLLSLPLAVLGGAEKLGLVPPTHVLGAPAATPIPRLPAGPGPSPMHIQATQAAIPTATMISIPTPSTRIVDIPVATGETSFGVTLSASWRSRYSDDEIAPALDVQRRVWNQCATVFARKSIGQVFSQRDLDSACQFTLQALRLPVPAQSIPTFLRDPEQARRGEVPLAGPVVIAINTSNASGDSMREALAHELAHGLGGPDRAHQDQCAEEGVANWVGFSYIGHLDDLTNDAHHLMRSGRLPDPRHLRLRQLMYAGDAEAVSRNYVSCGAFVAFIVSHYGGQDALIDMYWMGSLPGKDMDAIAEEYLATLR